MTENRFWTLGTEQGAAAGCAVSELHGLQHSAPAGSRTLTSCLPPLPREPPQLQPKQRQGLGGEGWPWGSGLGLGLPISERAVGRGCPGRLEVQRWAGVPVSPGTLGPWPGPVLARLAQLLRGPLPPSTVCPQGPKRPSPPPGPRHRPPVAAKTRTNRGPSCTFPVASWATFPWGWACVFLV